MTQDVSRLRAEFDRIARHSGDRAEPNRYERRLLRFVPRPCERVLDLGCGRGWLTRELADRSRHVLGVDLSPVMVQMARQRCADRPNVELVVGDFLALDLPAGHFDCVTAVAVLHHLPIDAVERMKQLLRPGGALLIVDLFRDDGLFDRLLSGAGLAFELATRPLRGQPRELREAWADHGRGDMYLTIGEARSLHERMLPGAEFRRHLFWRYSVVWTKT